MTVDPSSVAWGRSGSRGSSASRALVGVSSWPGGQDDVVAEGAGVQLDDNAAAESFFETLKNEMYYRRDFPTRAQARAAVADYIEVFYNRKRLHSTLGYQTPAEVFTQFQTAAAAA